MVFGPDIGDWFGRRVISVPRDVFPPRRQEPHHCRVATIMIAHGEILARESSPVDHRYRLRESHAHATTHNKKLPGG